MIRLIPTRLLLETIKTLQKKIILKNREWKIDSQYIYTTIVIITDAEIELTQYTSYTCDRRHSVACAHTRRKTHNLLNLLYVFRRTDSLCTVLTPSHRRLQGIFEYP